MLAGAPARSPGGAPIEPEASQATSVPAFAPESGPDFVICTAKPLDRPAAATKAIRVIDGVLHRVSGHEGDAAEWSIRRHHGRGFATFVGLLRRFAEEGEVVLLHGAPAVDHLPGARRRNVNLPERTNLIALDLDEVPPLADVDPLDAEAIAEALRPALPAPLRPASYCISLTPSHMAVKGGASAGIRCRLWFIADRAVTQREIEALLGEPPVEGERHPRFALSGGPFASPVPLDVSVWRSAQPNFIADPIVEGDEPDPLAARRFAVCHADPLETEGVPVGVPGGEALESRAAEIRAVDPRAFAASTARSGEPIDTEEARARFEATLRSVEKPLAAENTFKRSRHLALGALVHKAMDQGLDADDAIDRVATWAHEDTHGVPNVADAGTLRDDLSSYLWSFIGSRRDPVGCDYRPEWRGSATTAGSISAAVDEAETGTGTLERSKVAALPFKRTADYTRDGLPVARLRLVDGLLSEASLAAIYGRRYSGKSSVAVALEVAIAKGAPFAGRSTKQGAVIHFCWEGHAEVVAQLAAAEKAAGHSLPIVAIGGHHVSLPNLFRDKSAVAVLVATIRAVGAALEVPVVAAILDTLTIAQRGVDENSSKEVGVALDAMSEIRRQTGVTVVAVAHSGKAENGIRGSSAMEDDFDTLLEVDGERRTIAAAKVKGASGGATAHFDFETIDVTFGDDATPTTAPVIRWSKPLNTPTGGSKGRGRRRSPTGWALAIENAAPYDEPITRDRLFAAASKLWSHANKGAAPRRKAYDNAVRGMLGSTLAEATGGNLVKVRGVVVPACDDGDA